MGRRPDQRTNGGTPSLARGCVWGSDLSGSLQGAGGVGGLLRVTDHAVPTHYFPTHYFPTYDGNGKVSEYLTGAGTVSVHFVYDAFGNVVSAPASPPSVKIRYQFNPRLLWPRTLRDRRGGGQRFAEIRRPSAVAPQSVLAEEGISGLVSAMPRVPRFLFLAILGEWLRQTGARLPDSPESESETTFTP